jgi:hypothetical protein
MVNLHKEKEMGQNKINNSEVYQRLRECRVDFSYSKNSFYNGYLRLEIEKEKQEKNKKIIDCISIALSIFTISAIAVYLTNSYKDIAVIVIGLSSLFSILLSIFNIINNKEIDSQSFKKAADNYLMLYKKTKNIEASVIDNLLTPTEINQTLKNIHDSQDILVKIINVVTTREDYAKAKKSHEDGENGYTEKDFENS